MMVFGGNMVYLCKSKAEIFQSVKKIFKRKDSLSVCPFYDVETEYRLVMLDGECKLLFGKKCAKDNWKFNLCQGAIVVQVEEEAIKEKLIQMAKEVVKSLNIRFASVDIIKDGIGNFFVMEVNSGVMIHKYTEFVHNGREIAKEIYREAILKMLE